MRLVTKAPAGQWIKATNTYERIMAKAATLGMRDVGQEAVKQGRAAIAAGGFSTRWQNSLVAKDIPSSGYVLNPGEWIHTTINYADVFEHGARIAGSPFLWLPLPNVPPDPEWHRPHMTPGRYVSLVGPLVTIRRPNGTPMLGARIATTAAEPITRRALSRGLLGRGRTATLRGRVRVVPLFVAVPAVAIPKKFDVLSAVKSAYQNLGEYYLKHLEKYDGR